MNSSAIDSLRYAGFWRRLGALLLDSILILLPLTFLELWIFGRSRLWTAYDEIPSTLFYLFYNVYLVRRFGGTPGKLISGIRIRKVNGDAIGYREAVLRYLPDFVLGLLMSVGMATALLHLSDAEYHALSWGERAKQLVDLAPSWYRPLQIVNRIWAWSELIVLLTNRKKRALHDFIAGTVVVVCPSPGKSVQPTAEPQTNP
jgi:uncharacterized RDD family membrane protein YckC